jgi:hypothetical protein
MYIIGTKYHLRAFDYRDANMGTSKAGQQKNDKIEVIKVLIIAVLSFVVGFALVILFLRPTPPSSDDQEPEEEAQPSIAEATETANMSTVASESSKQRRYSSDQARGGYAPEPEPAPGEAENEEDAESGEGNAPPEVPPGKTPEGVTLDGSGFYLKCWDEKGDEHPGGACERLEVLEKRFSTRLYVVDRCKQKHAGEKAQGKLSLGVEVDFEKMSVSFWNGASSEIEGAGKIATCLRSELAGLPIHGIDHKHSRYRIFFTVLFGKQDGKSKAAVKEAESKRPGGRGKLVDVIKDRVRVRKAPGDGEVIGKISTGSQVKLLEKKAGWCRVITPNDNEGWMTCDALKE